MSDDLAAVNRLWDEGMAALDRSDPDAAEAIAVQLRERKHSSSFELAALVRLHRGDAKDAARVLEIGVEVAPSVWLLWNLLGNTRSDLRDYDGARDAYERGLACDGAYRAMLELNLAVVDWRQGRLEAALARIPTVEALAAEDADLLASARKTRFAILRDRRGRTSPTARAWRLTLQVEGGPMPFLQHVDVVADSAAEGLRLVVEDLGDEYARAVVESAREADCPPDAPLGIYGAMGRIYFPAPA